MKSRQSGEEEKGEVVDKDEEVQVLTGKQWKIIGHLLRRG